MSNATLTTNNSMTLTNTEAGTLETTVIVKGKTKFYVKSTYTRSHSPTRTEKQIRPIATLNQYLTLLTSLGYETI